LDKKSLHRFFSKSSFYFQQFFDPNQGSAGSIIDTFVKIKFFQLKIRSSTAVVIFHCLKKVSLFFFVWSLSYSVPSIDLVSCSVSDPHFYHSESERCISTTIQACFIILLQVNDLLNCKSAAARIVFLRYFLIK